MVAFILRRSLLRPVTFLSSVAANKHSTRNVASLKKQIVQRITIGGPITISEYMKHVLTAPGSGFYMKQDVFGKMGHFTTSPEISQIFGEMIGIWIVNEWLRFNKKKPFRIVELGPGRGTLLNDISRVLTQLSASRKQASLHMVEVSPFLVQVQEQNLCGHVSVIDKDSFSHHESQTTDGLPITWYKTIDQVSEEGGFTIYLMHEFLDAMPIHKFQRGKDGWKEVLIDYDDNLDLRYVLSKNPTPASKLLLDPNQEGDHFEASPEGLLVVDKIMHRLNRNEGCLLICDYGYDENDKKSRDTFRAFREHTQWDPLKSPGTADLTADVDFGAIRRHVTDKALAFGPVTQKHFLTQMGIEVRLQVLLSKAKEEAKADLKSGVNMILNDMGTRFKFMSIFPKNSASLFHQEPPGFAP